MSVVEALSIVEMMNERTKREQNLGKFGQRCVERGAKMKAGNGKCVGMGTKLEDQQNLMN